MWENCFTDRIIEGGSSIIKKFESELNLLSQRSMTLISSIRKSINKENAVKKVSVEQLCSSNKLSIDNRMSQTRKVKREMGGNNWNKKRVNFKKKCEWSEILEHFILKVVWYIKKHSVEYFF